MIEILRVSGLVLDTSYWYLFLVLPALLCFYSHTTRRDDALLDYNKYNISRVRFASLSSTNYIFFTKLEGKYLRYIIGNISPNLMNSLSSHCIYHILSYSPYLRYYDYS